MFSVRKRHHHEALFKHSQFFLSLYTFTFKEKIQMPSYQQQIDLMCCKMKLKILIMLSNFVPIKKSEICKYLVNFQNKTV